MIVRRIAVVVAVVVGLCTPSRSFAVTVSSADEICAPTVDPCTITKSVSVSDGALLDFGSRTVRITGKGQLDGGAGTWTLNCGELVVDVGVSLAIKARGPDGSGSPTGGSATINAFRQCSINSSTRCISDRNCSFGLCDTNVCSADTQFPCAVDANCQLGSCSAFVCSRASTRQCASDGDCSFGTCNAVRHRCSNNSSVFCVSDVQCDLGPCNLASPRCDGRPTRTCSSDADCDLGSCNTTVCGRSVAGTNRTCSANADCFDGVCSIGNGSITINGKIRADGSEAGSLQIRGAGDVVLSQSVNLSTTSAVSFGGFFEVESGAGSVTVDGDVQAEGGGQDSGGDVCALAGTDLVVNGAISVTGGEFDGGTVELGASRDVLIGNLVDLSARSRDGSGGDLAIDAGRDIQITTTGSILSNGHSWANELSGGDGGTQDYTAGGDFSLASGALLQSNGGQFGTLGGDITATVENNITVAGTIESQARDGEGDGGVIELAAGEVLTVTNTAVLDVAMAGSNAGDVDLSSGSDMIYDGTINARSANAPGSSVLFNCGANLSMSGSVIVGGVVGAGTFNGFFDADACRITLGAGSLVDNSGDFGDNTLTVGETMTLGAGSSLLADAASGSNTLIYRAAAKPPTLNGTVTPNPELIVDANIPGCPICGNSELEGGESCDDGNTVGGDGCSANCQNEGCLAQTQAPGFPAVPLCSDGDTCTLDSCDAATSTCVHTNDCSDGIACTIDTCDAVSKVCRHTADDSLCSDGNDCTADVCDPVSGCGFPPTTAACDDGVACTSGDVCSGGMCSGVSNCPQGQECNTQTGLCSSSAPVCGNGVTEQPDEDCDDGDTVWVAGEYCSAQCLTLACGDTNDDGSNTASDALFALRAAVGVSSCDACVCNVDNLGNTSASDALRLLMAAVSVPGITLTCPTCP